MRSPAPCLRSRRCAPLPSPPRQRAARRGRRRPARHAQPRRQRPAHAGRCPTRAQITELAWSPDGNRLAFVTAGELVGLDLADRAGADADLGRGRRHQPGVVGGRRDAIAFRRGLLVDRVAGGGAARRNRISARSCAGRHRPRLGAGPQGRSRRSSRGLLLLAGLELPPAVTGLPAWAPDKQRGRVRRAPAGSRRPRRAADAARSWTRLAGPPRWSPDASLARLPRRRRAAHRRARDRRTCATPLTAAESARAGRLAAVRGGRDASSASRSRRRAAARRRRPRRRRPTSRSTCPRRRARTRRSRPLSLRGGQAAGPRHARGPALHARAGLRRAGRGRLPRQQRRRASPRPCRVLDLRRPAPGAAAGADHAAAGARAGRAVPDRARDAAAGPQAHARSCSSRATRTARLTVRLTASCGRQARRSTGRRSSARSRPSTCCACGCGCRPSRAGR